ncbi:MAG: STAS domain-containing protein [Planctomycetaceae bacterium]
METISEQISAIHLKSYNSDLIFTQRAKTVSTIESPYRFESESGHAVVTLLPPLNDVPWADIERIGSDILGKFGAAKSPCFLVDLSSLTYMGSAMVALVVRLWKSAKERDGKMVVVNRDEMVLEVLTLAGLNKVWTIVEDRQRGLQALGSRGSLMVGDSGSGSGGWIPSLLGLIAVGAAGGGLYCLITKTQMGGQAAFGLLLGGAAFGLIFGMVAVLKGGGFPKVLGMLVMLAAVGVGVAGVMKMPAMGQAPAKQEGEAKPEAEGDAKSADDKPAAEKSADAKAADTAQPAAPAAAK